jgi:hypothetical protein
MFIDKIKSFENDTSVSDILSAYLMCDKKKLVQVLIGDDKDTSYGLLDYWADINNMQTSDLIDVIEASISNVAEFTVTVYADDYVKSILKLGNITIPLTWSTRVYKLSE